MSNVQHETNKLEWPMRTTSGNRAYRYYSDWQQQWFTCSRCEWTGTVSLADLDDPCGDAATIQCPKCYRGIGVVVFPNLSDTEEAAAQGNEEAIKALPGMQDRIRRFQARNEQFEQEKLLSVDQLEGAPFERITGFPLESYVSASFTYYFRRR